MRDEDEDGQVGWVAEIQELPGCLSQGYTREEALANLDDAKLSWISVALEDDLDIPEPRSSDSYSGHFVVRLPQSLHAELARTADREGISLNQFVANVLAGAVGWRQRTRHHALA